MDKIISVNINKLYLDPENPRIPYGNSSKSNKELLKILYEEFALGELADSMSRNGYFHEEPLVAIPRVLPNQFKDTTLSELQGDGEYIEFINNENTEFIVVEGNRRLATAKLLLNRELIKEMGKKEWPELTESIRTTLLELPVAVYSSREDVLPYLGVKHIVGIKKWEPYAKASYIVKLKENYNKTINDIQNEIGDRTNSIKKSFICYKIISTIENETDWETKNAKDNFSYLLLAIGQGSIKDYIGLPKNISQIDLEGDIIPNEKITNLKNLYSFLFGENKENYGQAISESRDITRKLAYILGSPDATKYLLSNRKDLDGAFDRTEGEQELLVNYIKKINVNLERALGIVHRYREDEEVKKLVFQAKETLDEIITKFKVGNED